MFYLLKILLWIAFFLSAILLGIIVLLQEGKGGGLAEAFGGIGAETFGVRSGGINRFTFGVATVFIGSAVLLHALWNT
jgi:preprotein translocase subunit SecG